MYHFEFFMLKILGDIEETIIMKNSIENPGFLLVKLYFLFKLSKIVKY